MDKEIIANIKSLGIDMIKQAGSGHPGIVLSAAPILYTLYAKHMHISFNDQKWMNRDHFILSAGHGSALLYSTLYLAGFLELNDLKQFRKIGSKTPGHPEYEKTPGVDMSTGPLGQGIGSAVGIALAEKYLRNKLTTPKKSRWSNTESIIDYYTYVLCGDGDMMEGVCYEACSLAGSLELDHLIVLYDSNQMSLDGSIKNVFDENVRARYEAMGWHTEFVKNGTSVSDIDRAIDRAKRSGKPSLIEVKTILGLGSLLENKKEVHGNSLTDEDVFQLKNNLQVPNTPFYVNEKAKDAFHKQIVERNDSIYRNWATIYQNWKNGGDSFSYQYLHGKETNFDLLHFPFDLHPNQKDNVREINRMLMNEISKHIPNLMGGNADLATSTKAEMVQENLFTKTNPTGRNIAFGVREHAMGSILNGLSLSYMRPFGATYLSFSDYLKPAIRMSAMMKLPVTYIFTHDSVAIGPDGPTHQPIEQLSSLRAIPNLSVFRPADGHELIGSWSYALQSSKTPSALVLSKGENKLLQTTDATLTLKGAYIVRKEQKDPHAIVIATGSEVHTALYLAKELETYGYDLRVVSMPCQELFLKQDKKYQEEVLLPGYKKIVIEAGSSLSWHQFVYHDKYLLTIDQFGASGTKDEVLKYCQFDYETLKTGILNLLK